MHIEPTKELYCGFTGKEIRDLMKVWYISLSINDISKLMHISRKRASNLISTLLDEEVITKSWTTSKTPHYEATAKGRKIACARLTKPILKSTALKYIEHIIQRTQIVNDSDIFMYNVNLLFVYGSFLSNKYKISDIDIVCDLVSKSGNGKPTIEETYRHMYKHKIRINSIIDVLLFPEEQVIKFLKNKSPIYHIVDLADFAAMNRKYGDINHNVIFNKAIT